jgi:hypothetical protein
MQKKFKVDMNKVNAEAEGGKLARAWHQWQTGQRRTAPRIWGYHVGLNTDEACVLHFVVEQRIIDAGGTLAHRPTGDPRDATNQAKRQRNYEDLGFNGHFASYSAPGLFELRKAWRYGRLG